MVQFGDFLKNKNLSKRNTFLNQKILSENLLFLIFNFLRKPGDGAGETLGSLINATGSLVQQSRNDIVKAYIVTR